MAGYALGRPARRSQAEGVDLSMLKHVSPIEWNNVVLYGQYVINRRVLVQAFASGRQRSVGDVVIDFARMWFLP